MAISRRFVGLEFQKALSSLLISIPEEFLSSKEKKAVFCHANLLYHCQLYICIFRKENYLRFMEVLNLNL